MSNSVRSSACAGRFFPEDRERLSSMVRKHLDEAEERTEQPPDAVVAPHAGLVFSGPIAGHAFSALEEHADAVDRAILVGPSHFVPFEGLAATAHEAFRTPLGRVPVDRERIDSLVSETAVEVFEEPHSREHSLETHLPYLQVVLGEFEIVPIVTGRGADAETAALLESVWEDERTVVSVSSDLSHYLTYDEAQRVDDQTRASIEALEPESIDDRQACGHTAIRGLLQVGRKRDVSVETLAMCNSGDTAGDKSEVVGYGAWLFEE